MQRRDIRHLAYKSALATLGAGVTALDKTAAAASTLTERGAQFERVARNQTARALRAAQRQLSKLETSLAK